jgi:hypothetical protein
VAKYEFDVRLYRDGSAPRELEKEIFCEMKEALVHALIQQESLSESLEGTAKVSAESVVSALRAVSEALCGDSSALWNLSKNSNPTTEMPSSHNEFESLVLRALGNAELRDFRRSANFPSHRTHFVVLGAAVKAINGDFTELKRLAYTGDGPSGPTDNYILLSKELMELHDQAFTNLIEKRGSFWYDLMRRSFSAFMKALRGDSTELKALATKEEK